MTHQDHAAAQATLDAAVAAVLSEPRIREAVIAAGAALLISPAEYEARYAEAMALVIEYLSQEPQP